MSRTKDTEIFLKRLTEAGGSSGNMNLRDTLGWNEDKYFRVRKQLIEEGLVEVGRGKGGSVYLPEDIIEYPKKETLLLAKETDHYEVVVSKLEKTLLQDFHTAIVEQTAHQGGKSTGGKWSRPDILAVTVQKFEYVLQDEFTLRSYEVKRSNMVDTDAVAEAAAHQRIAQYAYLIVVPDTNDSSIFEPSSIKRRNLEKECLKLGVGLILIADHNATSDLDVAVEPRSSAIDGRTINSTIGRLFSDQTRAKIKEAIQISRLGEIYKLYPRS